MIDKPSSSSRGPTGTELTTTEGVLSLQRSGLFDGPWFLSRNLDLRDAGGAGAIAHYHDFGWREHRWPNAYFDPVWYLAHNPDVRARDIDPLLHYAEHGEAEGRAPIAWFDPAWYRKHHDVPDDMLALAHFLLHRHTGRVSPVPEFDAPYYYATCPDVAAAGMDPFEHYLVRGAFEGRHPHRDFDPVTYRAQHLGHLPQANPLLHYRANRAGQAGGGASRKGPGIAAEVRRNTRPGPDFEEWSPASHAAPPAAKLLAFFLPQFHAVPENDAWWGKGFTEWTNVARAVPRFVGHYQPRIPRDLGHYSLNGPDVLRRQAAMAREAGLHGFVFYHYWFNGRRLLNGPVDTLLADASIDLPFCLMWANENWTRRWDGSEHEVLLSQDYHESDEPGFVADLMRHFADPRYIRLEGRPVLMVYRAGIIPAGALERWRRIFAQYGEQPYLVMAQSFDDRDPRAFGMDAAVEFPPHKLTNGLETINAGLDMLDPEATARVFAYDDLAAACDLSPSPFPLIRTAVPGWDNDARRQGAGMSLHGATPASYQAWLERLIGAAREQRVGGEALVCINAWNEWGEGAYLEPDVHFGSAFLNATSRAAAADDGSAPLLLLVGHDAFAAGAQLLLLNLGRALRATSGVRIAFLLLDGGALLADYEAVAPTTVLPGGGLPVHAAALAARGVRHAFVNTCASARAVAPLTAAGIACTLMVHELPRLLRERNLVEPARDAVALVQRVVFAATHVRDRFTELVPLPEERSAILLQGLYRPVTATDREARRAELRVPVGGTLAVGIGFGDLRKGFDLFLQAWRVAHRRDGRTRFAWVGDIDSTVAAYLGPEIAAAQATGAFHHIPFAADGADWLAAADVHLLTSREDPMPTVVLEAMSAGTPTIAFEESGAAPDLLREMCGGVAVPMGDVAALVRRMRGVPRQAETRALLAQRARQAFDFDRYAAGLLALACPDLAEVSVVVLSYNYAHYLPDRLASVFAQTHPVAEVIVLDDASTDDSEAVAHAAATRAGRRISWVGSERNSGNVFRQWRRAAELARGEYLWIAEADDLCEPGLLERLCRGAAQPGVVMAFCDGRAVDAEGTTLWADHKAYFKESGADLLAEDGVFDAADVLRTCLATRNMILNVSGVLFRRSNLLAALKRCEPALDAFVGAGDWRAYVELLSAGGRVAYVAKPLNVHRRHKAGVTERLPAARQQRETARMHRHMKALLAERPAPRVVVER